MTINQALKKRAYLFVIYFISFVLLIGGVLGILKRTVPGCENLSINALFGLQGQDPQIPLIIAYSLTLAVLEIFSALCLLVGLLVNKEFGLLIALITLGISGIGSIVAIMVGDISAAFSLLLRIIAIILLINSRRLIFPKV